MWQLINSVRSTCLHARQRVCLTLTRTVKALLTILPKRSLIQCRQYNGERKIKKQREDAAQKGNKVKAPWGPLNVCGPRGNSPGSPLSLGLPVAHALIHYSEFYACEQLSQKSSVILATFFVMPWLGKQGLRNRIIL